MSNHRSLALSLLAYRSTQAQFISTKCPVRTYDVTPTTPPTCLMYSHSNVEFTVTRLLNDVVEIAWKSKLRGGYKRRQVFSSLSALQKSKQSPVNGGCFLDVIEIDGRPRKMWLTSCPDPCDMFECSIGDGSLEDAQRYVSALQKLRQPPFHIDDPLRTERLVLRNMENVDFDASRSLVDACAIGALPKLRHLDVSFNPFISSLFPAFAEACGALPLLEFINLSDLGIGDAGITALAQAMKPVSEGGSGALPQCMYLHLGSNQIGDAGLAALADACANGAMANCTFLSLDMNDFGDAGVIALASACTRGALSKCEKLDLQSRSIGEDGVVALVQACARGALPALKRLWIHPNHSNHPKLVPARVPSRFTVSFNLN